MSMDLKLQDPLSLKQYIRYWVMNRHLSQVLLTEVSLIHRSTECSFHMHCICNMSAQSLQSVSDHRVRSTIVVISTFTLLT